MKITHNVAFAISILAFSTNFLPIKSDLSGNTVWPPESGFQKVAKLIVYGIFRQFLPFL